MKTRYVRAYIEVEDENPDYREGDCTNADWIALVEAFPRTYRARFLGDNVEIQIGFRTLRELARKLAFAAGLVAGAGSDLGLLVNHVREGNNIGTLFHGYPVRLASLAAFWANIYV